MVTGTENASYSFDAPTAGTVTAQLSNLPWPDTLSALSFSATTASDVVSSWSAADSSQTRTFEVGPGTYFAHILATAGGSLDVGLYSLTLSFKPDVVPLPGAAWMLLGGIAALFGLARLTSVLRPGGLRFLQRLQI
jgi:hypothetical protein